VTMISISAVRVEDRHRADVGDLGDLAESLRELGQLQPIVVTSDLRLIAGARRLAAAQSLGWIEIEAKIAHGLSDAATLLRAERDENTCRKSFTPTEEHSLYEALLVLQSSMTSQAPIDNVEEESAKEANTSLTTRGTRERQTAAEIATGRAGRHKTLEKIGEVKRIAEDQSHSDRLRQKAHEALAEMDRTGVIESSHRRVMLAVRAEGDRNRSSVSSWTEEEQSLLKELRDGRIVVVSLREHHANLVRWAEANGYLVPVDRRTEWGNPFEMPYDGDRETVIHNYAEHYFPFKPSLRSRVSELRGKALACWCAPEACHADILKQKAEEGSAL
jgi:ParB/RepB/Spo0J family partition protein